MKAVKIETLFSENGKKYNDTLYIFTTFNDYHKHFKNAEGSSNIFGRLDEVQDISLYNGKSRFVCIFDAGEPTELHLRFTNQGQVRV